MEQSNTLMQALQSHEPSPLVGWLRTQKVSEPLARLYGVDEKLEYHPEGDSGIHLELAIEQAWRTCKTIEERAAVLMHDIGKAVTGRAMANPTDIGVAPIKRDESGNVVPIHYGHDEIGAVMMDGEFRTLGLPDAWLSLAKTVARYHQMLHAIERFDAKAVICFVDNVAAGMPGRDRLEAVSSFVRCVTADFNGRLGFEGRRYRQGEILLAAARAVSDYDYESAEQTVAAIEKTKYDIFGAKRQAFPKMLEYHVWRDTMIALREAQAAGDVPSAPASVSSVVAQAIAGVEGDEILPKKTVHKPR